MLGAELQQSQNINNIWLQVHPSYNAKRDIWIQIAKSYSGGVIYRNAEPSYLYKFGSRESQKSFDERKKRAVFFNNTQPLVDMLVGFLFSGGVIRKNVTLEYLYEQASQFLNLDLFMQSVATNALMYTCGVLVDSPVFDKDALLTDADRRAAGINPYCTLYTPWQIRNFNFAKNGKLNYIVLDNSYYDNSNPLEQPKIVISLRLWTPEYYQDFTASITIDTQQNSAPGALIYNNVAYGINQSVFLSSGVKLIAGEQIKHPCGEVPFVFCNLQDRDQMHIVDTIIEDVVLFDQAVFNYMSLMDEMLYGGTIKILLYPGKKPTLSEGLANVAILEYPETASHEPAFAGPRLDDIEPFINAINFYLVGIKRLFGMDTDQEKSYPQSGEAKRYDYTKVTALLNSGATALENIEHQIFKYAGLWERKDEDVESEYKRDFLGEEQEKKLARMFQLLTVPYSEMRRQAARRVADINFNDELDDDEMQAMYDNIDKTEGEVETTVGMTVEEMAGAEKLAGSEITTPVSVEAESKAKLKGTVGGVQGILQIQQSVASGITEWGAAINMLVEIYGFDENTARSILGNPKKTQGEI